jgi:hypothetical protein
MFEFAFDLTPQREDDSASCANGMPRDGRASTLLHHFCRHGVVECTT